MPNIPTRKLNNFIVQLQAINRMHFNSGGLCEECGTEFPCRTRAAMRQATTDLRAGKIKIESH